MWAGCRSGACPLMRGDDVGSWAGCLTIVMIDSYLKSQRFISQESEIHTSRDRTFNVTESEIRVGDLNLKSQRFKFYYIFCLQSQGSEIHISRVRDSNLQGQRFSPGRQKVPRYIIGIPTIIININDIIIITNITIPDIRPLVGHPTRQTNQPWDWTPLDGIRSHATDPDNRYLYYHY